MEYYKGLIQVALNVLGAFIICRMVFKNTEINLFSKRHFKYMIIITIALVLFKIKF